MWEHYQEVADLQMAVIEGDLERAQAQGRWISEHETMEGLPDGSEPFVSEMRVQAGRVAAAPDLHAAAEAVGSMGRTCSTCHVAYGVQSRVKHGGSHDLTEEAGSSAIGLHVTAADHLWDGLVGPSDSMWNAGARGLEQVPWFEGRIGAEAGLAVPQQMAEDLRALGRRAGRQTDPGQRAQTYGEVLSRCASCHDLARKGRE
jgi:cytochrome c553